MTKKGEISNLKVWLFVLIALLDDVVVLVLIYIVLRLFGVKIPLVAGIVAGLVLGTAIFFIHKALLPSLRRRKVTGAEGMIGQTGQVTQPLQPRGIIKIEDEYWKAISIDGDVEAGGEVEIVGISGLVLEVKRKIS
jgi:membrane-bound serine protease (ClpP class)